MRHNRTQAEIGESLGVSQPTISRAISAISPLIPEAVREFVLTADDLDPDTQYILDGTLLPCWSWAGHEELYSGKQDHRNERTARLHDLRQARLDLRPGQRKPP